MLRVQQGIGGIGAPRGCRGVRGNWGMLGLSGSVVGIRGALEGWHGV